MAPRFIARGAHEGSAIYSLEGELLLWLDGNEQERHSRRATVSALPGPRVRTDSAQAGPGSFEVSGVITETPYTRLQNLGLERMRRALEILDEVIESGQQLIVTSELAIYSPVQMENWEVVKRAKGGQGVEVRIGFKRALIATIETSQVPASILNALVRDSARSPVVNRTTPAPASAKQDAAAQKSVLAGGLDGTIEALSRLGNLGTR